jgi:hypothetical protein
MARQTQTPPLVRACIACALIVGLAVTLVVGVGVFFHSLTHPQPEPDYIYEPKEVRKHP